MARGRKANLRVVGDDEAAGPGHNSGLTDDQRQALTRQHLRAYQSALAAKKEADAAFKNACKKAKAELGDGAVADIKLLIELSTDGGEQRFRDDMERQARVARWCGMPIGAQGNLFDEDRRPIEEKALEEGKAAGFDGKDAKPPYAPGHPGYDAWMRGWHEAQAVLASNFTKTPDAPLLRPADAEADDTGPDEFDAAADGE